jgi:hypothetical protein
MMMKRFSLLIAAVLLAAVAVPAAASAKIIELGQTSTPVAAPTCPKNASLSSCAIVLERTTAIQSVSDAVTNPTKVKKAGWIVAFTVGLSKISSNAKTERSVLHNLDMAYGGTPQLALTVLKPGPKNQYTVAAQSPMFHVIPFLGQVLQEPLSLPPSFSALTALPVKPGEVIGVTVPTWAPILSYNLNTSKFSYRQSRAANCVHSAASQTAQTSVGASTRYLCSYTGTRVQYTATEITTQGYPKTYVHDTRRP